MILTTLPYFLITIIVLVIMEGVAWFLHKFVMHGFGWVLHEDHHRYTKGRFEKNDIFGLIFSLYFLLVYFIWNTLRNYSYL